jgi:DNA-binding CsgD family transcriptional regulator
MPSLNAAASIRREQQWTGADLTNRELRIALDVLHAIGESCAGAADFAHRGVELLPRLAASDLTTLVVCDLDQGRRNVVPSSALSPGVIKVFDYYFHSHPLVREHGRNPQAVTKRISDLVNWQDFEGSPLYNEYYRAIGIDHVMAVPIHVDRRFLVSFVLNRCKRDFGEQDRDRLEILRPHLANLYRLNVAAERAREAPAHADRAVQLAELPLTPREREVLDWVGAGKTNRDIAAILGASPRTVEKHLERIYEKLGVETRTAAVMRALRQKT